MHSEERYKKLLDSYLAGTCTPEERRVVEEWFEKGGDIGKPDLQLSSAEQLRLLDRIHRKMDTPMAERPDIVGLTGPAAGPGKTIPLPYRWLAAAVCIGVLVTIGLTNLTRWRPAKTAAPLTFITIQTGKGQVKKITLPDQSTVWINANSVLSYHPDFINHRQLLLSGEALFDVAQDKLHAFSVLTRDSVNTEVLGTVFNISSHAGLGETDIAVISGKVQVSKLEPGAGAIAGQPEPGAGATANQVGTRAAILTQQQAIRYDGTIGSFARTSDIPTETAAWTKGQWVYNNMRIRDLAILLDDQYGVTIRNQHIKGEVLQTGMNVNFNRSQTAEDIVNIFCALAGSHYRKLNNTTFEIY